jgi:hypothetical protein
MVIGELCFGLVVVLGIAVVVGVLLRTRRRLLFLVVCAPWISSSRPLSNSRL